MLAFLGGVGGYIFKNVAVIIGVVEAVLKAAGAIISLTPTKRDDAIMAIIDKAFSGIKKWLYGISDKLDGKEPTVPNS